MPVKPCQSDTVKTRLKRWLLRQLIRFKWIKQEVYSEDELNALLSVHFPQHLGTQLVGSQGRLTILSAELSLPQHDPHVDIQLFTTFSVSVQGIDTYRAHVVISGQVTPYYSPQERAIRLRTVQLNEIRLVNDDYAFIRSSTDLVASFMPLGIGGLVSATMTTTLGMLKGVVPSDVWSYLNLYTSGSKQKVLDYHKPHIERMLVQHIEQEDWRYELDESDFEQQLFSELGREVVVEHGQLVFKFH